MDPSKDHEENPACFEVLLPENDKKSKENEMEKRFGETDNHVDNCLNEQINALEKNKCLGITCKALVLLILILGITIGRNYGIVKLFSLLNFKVIF